MTTQHIDNRDKHPKDVPFVRVDWEDIKFEDNWNDDIEHFSTSSATLWGHLIELTPLKVVIAHGYSWESEKWVTTHTLPVGACTLLAVTLLEGREFDADQEVEDPE